MSLIQTAGFYIYYYSLQDVIEAQSNNSQCLVVISLIGKYPGSLGEDLVQRCRQPSRHWNLENSQQVTDTSHELGFLVRTPALSNGRSKSTHGLKFRGRERTRYLQAIIIGRQGQGLRQSPRSSRTVNSVLRPGVLNFVFP